MIPIAPQPEYAEFDAVVRQPGMMFLAENPKPSAADFRKRNYWSRALPHLRAAYSGICAYTTRRLFDNGSVDHFWPKTKYPQLAYEWNNYRFARPKINSRKGNTEEVMDPFAVKKGWFVLDLPSCLIRPGDGLDAGVRRKINATIDILQLNSDDLLVQERCDWLVALADGKITMDFLDGNYFFLSSELKRQGVENELKVIFSRLA